MGKLWFIIKIIIGLVFLGSFLFGFYLMLYSDPEFSICGFFIAMFSWLIMVFMAVVEGLLG